MAENVTFEPISNRGPVFAFHTWLIPLEKSIFLAVLDNLSYRLGSLTLWQRIQLKKNFIHTQCILLKTHFITPLKLVDKFTYLGSSVASTEKDIDTRLTKAWTAINRLSIIWKSDLTDKMKRSFFQAAVASILLYGCTTWTLTKRLEKKLDGNYTRMLRAILNKSWRQHPTRHELLGHLPPITNTIQVRRTRHAGHCWRSRDELISDLLLWTPTHGRAKAGRPARTYIQQLCEDTGCCPEDLPEAMNDREKWRERVRDIRATSMTYDDDDDDHHHHVAPPARISLTVSRHFSLSFIASGRSSGLHPVSSHSCCM